MSENKKPAVICMLCNKRVDHMSKNVFGDPKICNMMTVATGNTVRACKLSNISVLQCILFSLQIAPEPALSGLICRNCTLISNLKLERKHLIRMNMMKMQIYYYSRAGNKQRVVELQNLMKLVRQERMII